MFLFSCHTLTTLRAAVCIGVWWQEDDLSLAIFGAVLLSCQDVIFQDKILALLPI